MKRREMTALTAVACLTTTFPVAGFANAVSFCGAQPPAMEALCGNPGADITKTFNVARIGSLPIIYFNPDGETIPPSDIRTRCGFDPDGTNLYYGIVDANVSHGNGAGSTTTGNPLHGPFFTDFVRWVGLSAGKHKILQIALEPPGHARADDYIGEHSDFFVQLAKDLDSLQKSVAKPKSLAIYIRYASEMNGGMNPGWYKRTFTLVRRIFVEHAANVLFSFDPQIFAQDTPQHGSWLDDLNRYWPDDDDLVDAIGGTWFISKPSEYPLAKRYLKQYVDYYGKKQKPFVLSEFGVKFKAPIVAVCDEWVECMLEDIQSLTSYEHVTILREAYGNETFAFLKPFVEARNAAG